MRVSLIGNCIKLTRSQLADILFAPQSEITISTGRFGHDRDYVVRSVEREDGSGRKFNLYVYNGSEGDNAFFVRIID